MADQKPQERFNEVHIGGVHIADVASGDVSAWEEALREAVAKREGGWFTIRTGAETHYTIHVGPTTDIVLRYRD